MSSKTSISQIGKTDTRSESAWAENSGLEVRLLRVLLAVVETGSVRSAADALGLAQSTVSEALSSLDAAVGTTTVLRQRGSHRLSLTPAGKALFPYARRVLKHLGNAHRAIAAVSRTARARVNVMTNESVSTYLLPGALSALRRKWPNTRFAVSVGTCNGVRSAVSGGECELGLLLEPAGASTRGSDDAERVRGVPATPIVLVHRIPLVVFASPAHTLADRANRGPLRRAQLAPYPLFVSDSAGDFHDLVRKYLGEDRLPSARLESAGSIEGVKRGVAADRDALGILPLYSLEDELRNGGVRAVRLTPPPPDMRLVAYFAPSQPTHHPAIRELLRHLGSTKA